MPTSPGKAGNCRWWATKIVADRPGRTRGRVTTWAANWSSKVDPTALPMLFWLAPGWPELAGQPSRRPPDRQPTWAAESPGALSREAPLGPLAAGADAGLAVFIGKALDLVPFRTTTGA